MMKILIPVDGSANSLRAVEYAIGLASALREPPTFLLLNVQWNVAAANVKLFINQDTINDYYREQGNEALRAARGLLDAANLAYQYHISIGTPAQAVVQYAEEQAVNLIVMGRQGESRLQSLLLGSVGGKVAQLASMPVMLIN
jgi:nucleotide-binding universal stress UspA family protein